MQTEIQLPARQMDHGSLQDVTLLVSLLCLIILFNLVQVVRAIDLESLSPHRCGFESRQELQIFHVTRLSS